MIAAIIPARGGSKRIPGKKTKLFCQKPIIAYSIEAARASGIFDVVIVTTDDNDIAAIARDYGAQTPFKRPPELSDDHTPTAPVLKHAVEMLQRKGQVVDAFCCIYATAPFVRAEYLRQGYETLAKNGVSSVFSVTSFPFPIFRGLKINEQGHLAMFWPEHELTRSNDLPEAYHDAGQFYWLNTEKFLRSGSVYAPDAMPVILPRYLVQDIDTPEDWQTAEYMYKALQAVSS